MTSLEGGFLEGRNKILIRSFIEEIFNEHNLSSIEKYFGKESVVGSPPAGRGGQGFKHLLSDRFIAFLDVHTTIEHIIAENNLAVAYLNGSGTMNENFMGPPQIRHLYKIENGKITEHWDVADRLNLLKGQAHYFLNAESRNSMMPE
jgi:predicted SnoaL-like aldol condensation-catalyzing enzyme